MKKLIVTGAKGMLGQALCACAPCAEQTFALDVEEMDITDARAVDRMFALIKPHSVIHTAAYTQVDKAESDRDAARRVNRDGCRNIAAACKRHGAYLVAVSTDYVYDGDKADPYSEDDAPNPQSVYGLTKLQGEQAIADTLEYYSIVRTSWLYGPWGGNFVNTMLRLAQTKPKLQVVADQCGSPTYSFDLARALLLLALFPLKKQRCYLFANSGYTNWAAFAQTIFKQAGLNTQVEPIATSAYPTAAQRPKNSRFVLDRFIRDTGFAPRTWQAALREYLRLYGSVAGAR